MSKFNTKKSLAAALSDIGVRIVFNVRTREGGIPQHKLTYDVHSCWVATNCTLDELFEHGQRHKAHIQENQRLAAQQRASVEIARKAEQQKATEQRRAEQRAEIAAVENRIIEVAKRLEESAWSKDASPHAKRVAGIIAKVRLAIEGHRKALVEFTDSLATNSAYALDWASGMFEVAARYKVAVQLGGAIAHADANRCDETTEALAARLNERILKEIVSRAGNVPSSTSVTSNLLENYERAAWADFHSSKCW